MAIAKTVFTNPPAAEVRVEVQFANVLAVADQRFSFHDAIKAEFPLVVIPEQKDLRFDFGDYTLYTQNQAYRLEIAMNYFRLVAARYRGYQEFRQMFLSVLEMFARHYKIPGFGTFTFQYKNNLPPTAKATFADYFTIDVRFPEDLRASLYTGKGMLVVQQEPGLILLEFEPQFLGSVPSSYKFNLTYVDEQFLTISPEDNRVVGVMDLAHTRLTDFFFSVLHPGLIEHLKQL